MAVQVRLVWVLGIMALAWVAAAAHTALAMRRYGRRAWVWFLICLFLSVLPAAVVSYVDYFRQLGRYRAQQGLRRVVRCHHCGAVVRREELRLVGGHDVCPRCGMVIGGDEHA